MSLHANFVHLRVHTAFSLTEGAIKVPDLIAACVKDHAPAVAITDTGNLFGALEFALTASGKGVQPIIGCQLAITVAEPEGGGMKGTVAGRDPDQLVVLVQDEAGYQNLMHLVSKSFLDGEPGLEPQLSLDDLAGKSEGLIALTGGPKGAVGRLLGQGQGPAALGMIEQLQTLFPGRLYVELQRHGLEIEDQIEAGLIDLAYSHELPLVATNESFFADESMYAAHDALLCVAGGNYVSQTDRRRVTPEHRFKTAREMRALFADLPEAVDNTLVVAQRCAYMPTVRKPILPPFETESGLSEEDEIRAQAGAGLADRLERHVFHDDMDDKTRQEVGDRYRDRLKFELDVIVQMGFSGYFLIVADFIKWAKRRNIPVGPGRGSGAGSVAAWVLTITDLDPLRWGLLFERFLNPERVSMPDFDIDFCQDRRDEVIHYVQEKYGADRVAQIITFGKLQARAVLRDVGRVLEMPYGQVDRISKLVPSNPANPVSLSQGIAQEPRLQEMRREDESVAQLLSMGLRLEGLYRNSSTHAAGVVIGDRPLQELVPLFRDPRSPLMATQFNMKYVELAGLVKFDFLGLKTLTVLARALELLARRGITVELETLPLDDEKTFELMSRGDTKGVFQFESTGMRSLLRDARVDTFEDIIALVALYRPGPMENIPKYTACKHGREKPEFLHESIEPVVQDTYGVIIYQEQVMRIAQVFAGFTLGQADLLRRAMGKKIKAEMDAQRGAFVEGAMARDVPRDRAEYVFDLVDKFAGYGFNKAHSAGYALVAYHTAYLKAHYPVEFLAACMSFDMSNTDKLAEFRQELQRLELPLLPPDLNRSEPDFIVEAIPMEEGGGGETENVERSPFGIRYALAAVKGVGRAAMEQLVEERELNGPFADPMTFAGRIDPQVINKRQLENLTAAGAFDSLVANRARVFSALDSLLSHAQSSQQERKSGQTNLFGDSVAGPAEAAQLPDLADWPQAERLARELNAIGFYLSAHPLDEYGVALKRLGVVPAGSLLATVQGIGGTAPVKLAGVVLGKQVRTSQKGSRYAFVQLSDPSGVVEIMLFSEILAEAEGLLDGDKPLLITASARLDDDQVKLNGQRVALLEEAAADTAMGMQIWLGDPGSLKSLKGLIEREAMGKGKGKVSIVVPTEDQEIQIALKGGFKCGPEIQAAIRSLTGIVEVQEL
ncbi:MAG: DNA polymerase III subunit alpha [Alphaproteobacteria bacterium]